MKDAGNASLYLEHAKLLDIEDCHHHRHRLVTQGPEYLPGEVDFTCLPFLCGVQPAGALQQRTVRGCCCQVPSLFRTYQSCSRHKFSLPQVNLLSNITKTPQGRREEPHPPHPATMGAELGVRPSRFSTHHHPHPGSSRAWESLWVDRSTRSHMSLLLSYLTLPLTTRFAGMAPWGGLFPPKSLHMSPCQGTLMWAHDATPQGGGRAQQGTPNPGQGLRDAWKVWDLPSKGEGGAHLTSVGEKAMRTSRVTALLTFRSSVLCPASPELCCPDCSSLWDKGAVGRVAMGMSPQSLSRPSLPLPEQALPQAGTREARRAPQLRAVLGWEEDAVDDARVLLRHLHLAALTVLITPRQLWGGWEQVTTEQWGDTGSKGRDGRAPLTRTAVLSFGNIWKRSVWRKGGNTKIWGQPSLCPEAKGKRRQKTLAAARF